MPDYQQNDIKIAKQINNITSICTVLYTELYNNNTNYFLPFSYGCFKSIKIKINCGFNEVAYA